MVNRERERIRKIHADIKGRCYNPNHKSYKSYGGQGVTVCDEWLKFNSFYDWYIKNYYKVGDERMCMDKDIINPNSLEYSPENCLILPIRINNLFINRRKSNGGLPTGVRKSIGGYVAKISAKDRNITGENIHLGTFPTPELAGQAYTNKKKEIILEVAEDYKNKIPKKVYDALINYTP